MAPTIYTNGKDADNHSTQQSVAPSNRVSTLLKGAKRWSIFLYLYKLGFLSGTPGNQTHTSGLIGQRLTHSAISPRQNNCTSETQNELF